MNPTPDPERTSERRPPLFRLLADLLAIGAGAFGGLGAAIALIDRRLVERRGWLTSRDLSEALAFTKPLPGSTVVQIVAFVAWRLAGWRGALLGSLAFVAPAGALMIAAAAASARLPDAPWVDGALTGVQVAVAGLLVSAIWRLGRAEARGRTLTTVALAAFALGLVVNAVVVIVGLGAIGAIVGSPKDERG